jgi:chaperonin GroES
LKPAFLFQDAPDHASFPDKTFGARANPGLQGISRGGCGGELIHGIKKNNKEKASMAINLKPLGDRVLVEPAEEKEIKKGGIIIPDTAKEKPTEGIVRALGTGKTDDNGKKIPFEVKVGDRVLVSKYGGTEIKLDGKDYKILNSDDILGVID